jgi:hypothetical protein
MCEATYLWRMDAELEAMEIWVKHQQAGRDEPGALSLDPVR